MAIFVKIQLLGQVHSGKESFRGFLSCCLLFRVYVCRTLGFLCLRMEFKAPVLTLSNLTHIDRV